MKRRQFLHATGVSALAAPVIIPSTTRADEKKTYEWKMVTTWPKNFPGVGAAAEFVAKKITELTDGQIQIKVYGAGELVPPMEVFDAVSRGTADMGHGASYYWRGKSEAFQFFTSVPFGLVPQEMNSWLYHGGGLALWQEGYAKFNLVPAPAMNVGVQTGGWFNKPINSIADLKGLKMRIPGLGGEVLKKLGGVPVNLPGGEIFSSLQSGVIDAAEFAGPYNDLAAGFYKIAKFYYYPGWQEPGSISEIIFNKTNYDALPVSLQQKLQAAARIANQEALSESMLENANALSKMVSELGVQLKPFPPEVLVALQQASEELLRQTAEKDEYTKRVYQSYYDFRKKVAPWSEIAEKALLNARQV